MVDYDVLLLAGAVNRGELLEYTGEKWEALIDLGGRPMISYVVDAVMGLGHRGRTVVVGPVAELTPLLPPGMEVIEGGNSLVENLQIGLETLPHSRRLLFLTTDIPFLTTSAIQDFLEQIQKVEADICYTMVSKETNERAFPGVERTYFRLKEGVFTGGNVMFFDPSHYHRNRDLVREVLELRKKPLQMAMLLGIWTVLKLATGRLPMIELEAKASKILNMRAKVIISSYPEVGVDIDKPSDLRLAREMLKSIG